GTCPRRYGRCRGGCAATVPGADQSASKIQMVVLDRAPTGLAPGGGGSGLDDGVVEGPEPGDLHPHAVASLEEGRGLPRESDAGRRPGDDNVPRQQGHLRGQVGHEVVDVEDEVLRVAVLELGSVHPGAELEDVRVWNLGTVGDPGAHRREGVARL